MKKKQDKFFEQYYKKNLPDFKNKLDIQGDKNNNDKELVVASEETFSVGEKKFEMGAEMSKVIPSENDYSTVSTEEKKEKERVLKEREYKLGSRVFPAIGILSILIGVGFFLKDYFVLGDVGKVVLGCVVGTIFIATGERIRKKFLGYSTFLMGGGFAVLHLSAKFGLVFDLYSNAATFILMIIITTASVLISYKLNSRIIAFAALIGGFLSPVMASSGVANELVLFNYILILLGGMFFLAWKKGWIELIIGSAIGAIILYLSSMSQYYTNSEFGFYWSYLLIFFSIFTVAPFLMFFSKDNKFRFFNYGNLILPVVVGGIFISVSYYMFGQMATGNKPLCSYGCEGGEPVEVFRNLYFIIGLIPAVLYLALSKISLQKFSITKDKVPVYFFISMASFAIAMIPALQFSGNWITVAWFLQALVLALITYKTKIKIFLNVSLAILISAIFRLFAFESYIKSSQFCPKGLRDGCVSDFVPILNERFLIFSIGIFTVFSVAYIFIKFGESKSAKIIAVTGNFIFLFWILMETSSAIKTGYLSSGFGSLILSISYLMYASVLMYFGILKKWSGFRVFSIVIFGFVILKTYFIDIWSLSEVLRILAFIILGIVILIVGYFYTKNKEKIRGFLKS